MDEEARYMLNNAIGPGEIARAFHFASLTPKKRKQELEYKMGTNDIEKANKLLEARDKSWAVANVAARVSNAGKKNESTLSIRSAPQSIRSIRLNRRRGDRSDHWIRSPYSQSPHKRY